MLDLAGGDVRAGRCKLELLIIKSGPAILDIQLCYDEENSGCFEVFIRQAIGPEQFGSAHLEINGVYTVVDNTALIGFVVAGLDGYCAGLNGRIFGQIHFIHLSINF